MKPSLLFLLYPLLAAAQATDAGIEITCQKGSPCTANPPYLVLQSQKHVIVNSAAEWDCFLYNPAGDAADTGSGANDCRLWTKEPPPTGNHPALIFLPRKEGQAQVTVPILWETESAGPSEPGGKTSLTIPLGLALLAVLSAGLSLMLWLGAGRAPEVLLDAQERLRVDLQPLLAAAGSIQAKLQFRPLPPAEPVRASDAGASEETRRTFHPAAPASGGPAPPVDRNRLIGRLDDWTKLAGKPPEIEQQHLALLTAGPNVPPAALQKIAQTMAQAAVSSTDQTYDPSGKNLMLQIALKSLVESAGLSLIEPQPQDSFDDARHYTLSPGSPAPSAQLRKRIAGVKRRGLARDGRVVEKAEVILYD